MKSQNPWKVHYWMYTCVRNLSMLVIKIIVCFCFCLFVVSYWFFHILSVKRYCRRIYSRKREGKTRERTAPLTYYRYSVFFLSCSIYRKFNVCVYLFNILVAIINRIQYLVRGVIIPLRAQCHVLAVQRVIIAPPGI